MGAIVTVAARGYHLDIPVFFIYIFIAAFVYSFWSVIIKRYFGRGKKDD